MTEQVLLDWRDELGVSDLSLITVRDSYVAAMKVLLRLGQEEEAAPDESDGI